MWPTERQDLIKTPLCDLLTRHGRRNLASFHTICGSVGRLVTSSSLRSTYEALLGPAVLGHDLTLTGDAFDSPVMPRRCIEESRKTTARAFGADYTCYVTMGTTISNWISVLSLAREGDRVLADRWCHQSIPIPFHLLKKKCEVTYGKIRRRDEGSGRVALDVSAFIEEYRAAHRAGHPYKLVILNSSSYEGLMYDIGKVFAEIVTIRDGVTFLVDEAWLAFGMFHPFYRPFTAMGAGRKIAEDLPDKEFAVVSTQSAHKSLPAMRQGSFIHIQGNDDLIWRIKEAQYKIHTTSPSYPILASLELARALIVSEGQDRIENALKLARGLREELGRDPDLVGYAINESPELADFYTLIDPLRVSIDVSKVTDNAKHLKDFLHDKHDIFISRVTQTAILLNIHIGICQEDVHRVLEGLRQFARTVGASSIAA